VEGIDFGVDFIAENSKFFLQKLGLEGKIS
jgi:hypothetical protein